MNLWEGLVEVAKTFKCTPTVTCVSPDDLIPGEMRDVYYYDPLMLYLEQVREHMTGKVDWL